MKRSLASCGLIIALLAGSLACNRAGGDTGPQQQVRVTRGDLALKVNGSGTLQASRDVKLTFGSAGRIEQVFFEEGDEVRQGDIIAVLETDALELGLAQARLAYAQAQLSANQSELGVAQARVGVVQADLAVASARIALDQTARTSTVSDLVVAQAEVDTAKRNLDDSLMRLALYAPGSPGYVDFQKNVVLAEARLNAARDRLDGMLSGFGSDEIQLKRQQVSAAEQSSATARQSLSLAMLTADLAQQSLEAAGLARDNAQKTLDKSSLAAPFSGVIASLPVDVGDSVLPSTVVARLMEPDTLELTVQIDEVDIPGVIPGQKAVINVDALPDTDFGGTVKDIGAVPRRESGVVLFDVKIVLDTADGSGLRNGMSASADIVTVERTNVLLVPSRLIRTNSQGSEVVEVSVNGKAEERPVTSGLSDGLETEITGGLTESDILFERRP